MGLILHDAIVITTWNRERIQLAFDRATELELPVSNIIEGIINQEFSFLVAPDGSKEGWAESNKCEEARAKLIEWLRLDCYDFCYVRFGGDYPNNAVLRDHNR